MPGKENNDTGPKHNKIHCKRYHILGGRAYDIDEGGSSGRKAAFQRGRKREHGQTKE